MVSRLFILPVAGKWNYLFPLAIRHYQRDYAVISTATFRMNGLIMTESAMIILWLQIGLSHGARPIPKMVV